MQTDAKLMILRIESLACAVVLMAVAAYPSLAQPSSFTFNYPEQAQFVRVDSIYTAFLVDGEHDHPQHETLLFQGSISANHDGYLVRWLSIDDLDDAPPLRPNVEQPAAFGLFLDQDGQYTGVLLPQWLRAQLDATSDREREIVLNQIRNNIRLVDWYIPLGQWLGRTASAGSYWESDLWTLSPASSDSFRWHGKSEVVGEVPCADGTCKSVSFTYELGPVDIALSEEIDHDTSGDTWFRSELVELSSETYHRLTGSLIIDASTMVVHRIAIEDTSLEKRVYKEPDGSVDEHWQGQIRRMSSTFTYSSQ